MPREDAKPLCATLPMKAALRSAPKGRHHQAWGLVPTHSRRDRAFGRVPLSLAKALAAPPAGRVILRQYQTEGFGCLALRGHDPQRGGGRAAAPSSGGLRSGSDPARLGGRHGLQFGSPGGPWGRFDEPGGRVAAEGGLDRFLPPRRRAPLRWGPGRGNVRPYVDGSGNPVVDGDTKAIRVAMAAGTPAPELDRVDDVQTDDAIEDDAFLLFCAPGLDPNPVRRS